MWLFLRCNGIEAYRDLQNMALELAGDDIPLSNVKAIKNNKSSRRQWQRQARDEALRIYKNVTTPKLDPISNGRTSLSAFKSASKTSPTSYLSFNSPDEKNSYSSDAEVASVISSVVSIALLLSCNLPDSHRCCGDPNSSRCSILNQYALKWKLVRFQVAVILTSVMRKIYPNATTIGILADSLGLGKEQVSDNLNRNIQDT